MATAAVDPGDWETVHTPGAAEPDDWETVPAAQPQTTAPSVDRRFVPGALDASQTPFIPTDSAGLQKWIQDWRSFGHGITALPIGVAQLAVHGARYLGIPGAQGASESLDRQLAGYERNYQTLRQEAQGQDYDPNYDPMSVAGETVSPTAFGTAGAVARGARAVGLRGTNFLSRLGQATVTGASIGAEQPVYNPSGDESQYWGAKGLQSLFGAAIGGGTEAVAGGIAPWATEQARHLADRYGIRVPFLSSLGPFAGRVEQISQSVPGSGMAVRSTYNTATEDLNRAAANEALDPIRPFGFGGPRYTPDSATAPGREMARETAQAISDSYDNVIPRMQSTLDPQFIQDVAAARASLPERVRGDFDDAVQRHIYNYAELGQPGTAPQAPPRFVQPRTPGQAGYDINLTIGSAGQPGQMSAQGTITRPPPPPRQTAPTDPARAALHAQNLNGAGADPQAFEQAMDYLNNDRGVRVGELQQAYQGYTGRAPGRGMTRDDMINGIRQEFQGRQTQSPFMLNGQNAKNADMGLRDEARSLIQNPGADFYQRDVGRALTDVRDALRDAWGRHSPQDAIDQLNATDLAYRRNMILNRAATSSASPEGVFGPTQLWQAVKAQDPTLGKRATAQGVAQMQDLADAAKTVLGKTVADSGTPERAALMAVVGHTGNVLTGLGALSGAINPTTLAGLGTHAALYTGPGQAALRMLSSGLGQGARGDLSQAIRAASPGIDAAAIASQPYDNKPRSVREWRAEMQKRQQAAQTANDYYGGG